jgi:hypothetical protein
MRSPGGWKEPGQTPEFEQYTLVLKGVQHVEDKDGSLDVRAGQLSLCARVNGYRIRLWSRGAEYIVVCHPAFSMGRCMGMSESRLCSG